MAEQVSLLSFNYKELDCIFCGTGNTGNQEGTPETLPVISGGYGSTAVLPSRSVIFRYWVPCCSTDCSTDCSHLQGLNTACQEAGEELLLCSSMSFDVCHSWPKK